MGARAGERQWPLALLQLLAREADEKEDAEKEEEHREKSEKQEGGNPAVEQRLRGIRWIDVTYRPRTWRMAVEHRLDTPGARQETRDDGGAGAAVLPAVKLVEIGDLKALRAA